MQGISSQVVLYDWRNQGVASLGPAFHGSLLRQQLRGAMCVPSPMQLPCDASISGNGNNDVCLVGDGRILLYDCQSGRHEVALETEKGTEALCVDWFHESFAIGTSTGELALLSKDFRIQLIPAHSAKITAIKGGLRVATGPALLTGDSSGILKIWSTDYRVLSTIDLKAFTPTLHGLEGIAKVMGSAKTATVLSGSGYSFLVEADTGAVHHLNPTSALMAAVEERDKMMQYLPICEALVIASNTGALTLWDIHSHSTIACNNFPGLIHAMAAAPTGHTLAVSVELQPQPQQSEGTEESAATEGAAKERKRQGVVTRNAVADGASRRSPSPHRKQKAMPSGSHRSTAGAVPSSGRTAAARTEAKEAEAAVGPAVMLLEGATLQQLQRLPPTSGHATALAWNSDGSSLAVGSNDGGITIWRRSDSGGNGSGNGGSAAFVPVLESVKGEGKGVAHLAWSVDGKLLCSGDAHGEVRYWRVAAGISAAAAEASEGKRHPLLPVASGESLSLLYREEYATEDNGAPSSQLEEVDAGGAGSGGEGREGSSEVWEAHWLDGAGGLGRVARDALLRLWYGEEGRGGLVLSGMQRRSEDGGGGETEVRRAVIFMLPTSRISMAHSFQPTTFSGLVNAFVTVQTLLPGPNFELTKAQCWQGGHNEVLIADGRWQWLLLLQLKDDANIGRGKHHHY